MHVDNPHWEPKGQAVLTGRKVPENEKEPAHKMVPNKADIQEIKNEEASYQTEYHQDFTKAAADYWKTNFPEDLIAYKQGVTDGKFGKKDLTIPNYFDRIYESIRQVVLTELGNNKETAEDLKFQFKALEANFKLLSEAINKKNDKANVNAMLAQFQGFINSFIENNIDTEE